MFLEGRGDFSAGRSTLCRNGSKARFEVSCPRVERGDDSTCDLFLRVVYIDLLATITVFYLVMLVTLSFAAGRAAVTSALAPFGDMVQCGTSLGYIYLA